MNLYDKHGREFMRGDLVRMFHFELRGRKHYMYKYVIGRRRYQTHSNIMFSNLTEENIYADYYVHYEDGSILTDYEIIQGKDLDNRQTIITLDKETS